MTSAISVSRQDQFINLAREEKPGFPLLTYLVNQLVYFDSKTAVNYACKWIAAETSVGHQLIAGITGNKCIYQSLLMKQSLFISMEIKHKIQENSMSNLKWLM